MLELLAPAGSPEAVTAAVQSGADAVYLGFGDYNARRNAKNFSQEEFVAAVSYCHIRGAKVYLTMNTLLSDRELPGAAEAIALASRTGLDAVLVQDLGAARMIRQSAPDLPIHASTQMTLHNLDGVKLAADLGMTRAVLSRELSRDQIAHICAHSPIEIEVFVHGALCMCYSGQCYFSSVIGGRSGNRGLCAQPCRMAYGWGLRPDAHPLSLKDMSLAGHMRELEEMGVACVKIEGRMKRPEYVAIVTAVYAAAIREKREPTEAELRRLSDAFSRQGFTDAYYRGEKGPEMFGVREEAPDTTALFSEVRNRYMNREAPRVPVRFYALAQKHEPVQVAAQDEQGHLFAVSGPVPEEARMRSLRDADFETHLKKTGGTPYDCQGVRAYVEPDLALPVSAINALRREALEGLSALRAKPPERRG
ncbi:MAG TPA: U32 family peptidase, partial [Oscillospiraceae bacterium]|nr:U32 family peptidase [Oscillospiraceae bacterium]